MILGLARTIGFVVDTAVTIPIVLVASLADRDAKVAYAICRWWAWLNARVVCASRVRVSGLEHLDPSASYVFMANHRSNFDVLATVVALWDFQLRWVAKEELARIPFFGWALRATKHIIVNRKDHAQALASLEAARGALARGISVIFFPEGTRSPDGQLLPFKKGGFMFALETGAPIVPIAIRGTAAILPRGHWLVRQSGDVDVLVRPPIPTAGLTVADRDALMARVQADIEAALGAPAAPRPRSAPAAAPHVADGQVRRLRPARATPRMTQ